MHVMHELAWILHGSKTQQQSVSLGSPGRAEVNLFGSVFKRASIPFTLYCSIGMLGTKCRRQTTAGSTYTQEGRKSRTTWWFLQRRLLSSRPATPALCREGKSSGWSWRGSWQLQWLGAMPCFPPTAKRHLPRWPTSKYRAGHDTWKGSHWRRNRGGQRQKGRNTCTGCCRADQMFSGAMTSQSQRSWSQQNHLALHPVQSMHWVAWQLLHLPNPGGSQSGRANTQRDGAH